MQVILLEHVRKLGKLGDLVKVKSGFARNFLIPYGKAEPATKINLEKFEEKRAELEKKANAVLKDAQTKAEVINGKEIIVKAMASDEGKLYGGISGREISEAIAEQSSLQIDKKNIMLPDGPIHSIDAYDITIAFDADVSATIHLKVERQSEKH